MERTDSNNFLVLFLKHILWIPYLPFLKSKKWISEWIFKNGFFLSYEFPIPKTYFAYETPPILEWPKTIKNNLDISKNVKVRKEKYKGMGRVGKKYLLHTWDLRFFNSLFLCIFMAICSCTPTFFFLHPHSFVQRQNHPCIKIVHLFFLHSGLWNPVKFWIDASSKILDWRIC